MAGSTFRLGLMAGACCAALGLLVSPASAQTGADAGSPFELAFWQAVASSNDPVLYEAYLKQYPAGTFAAIAHVKVDGLRGAALPNPPAMPLAAPPATKPATGNGGLALSLPAPLFGAGLLASVPGAASALKDAAAAKLTAEAAQAAASAAFAAPSALPPVAADAAPIAADRPVVTAMIAPPAPIAPPAFAFGSAPGEPAQDLFGNAAAMPVGSQALLASLSPDAAPAVMPAAAIGAPALEAPAPKAPTAMLAALGAAPSVLPGADALQAAMAAQVTPARLARVETAPMIAPVVQAPLRPQYASATFAPRARKRRDARSAQFMRAVVSTAAVSVEMPDATSQISPLGIMLGQMVRTQETPGTQFGLQEDAAMPLRPRLMAVPDVALPESFCSAEQRSAFSEGIYQPALAIAQHNAHAAGAYVRKLRTLYDNYQLIGDSTALASVSAEARDFSRAANAASSIHDTLVNQFEDIMTTPVGSCGAIQ